MIDRATWDNSPQLRDGIRDRLASWGWYSHGGMPNLGYPSHQPFTHASPSETAPPEPDFGLMDAEAVELIIRKCRHDDALTNEYAKCLKQQYVYSWLTERAKARAVGLKKTTYRRRVESAEYWFYCCALTNSDQHATLSDKVANFARIRRMI